MWLRFLLAFGLLLYPVTPAVTAPHSRPTTGDTSSIYRDAVDAALASALDGDFRKGTNLIFRAIAEPSISQKEVQLLTSYGAVIAVAGNDIKSAKQLSSICSQEAPLQIEGALGCAVIARIIALGRGTSRSSLTLMANTWVGTPEGQSSLGQVLVRLRPSEAIGPEVKPPSNQPQGQTPARPVIAGKRFALVIGNGQYSTFSDLPNPSHDAKLIAKTLRNLGFSVDMILDADQASMKRSTLLFGRKLRSAGNDVAGIFYYGGHGLQMNGLNYLIPVNAKMSQREDVYGHLEK